MSLLEVFANATTEVFLALIPVVDFSSQGFGYSKHIHRRAKERELNKMKTNYTDENNKVN